VNQKPLRTALGPPTPELPVEDVELAQQHYRDALGFETGWLVPEGDIGAQISAEFDDDPEKLARPMSERVGGISRSIRGAKVFAVSCFAAES